MIVSDSPIEYACDDDDEEEEEEERYSATCCRYLCLSLKLQAVNQQTVTPSDNVRVFRLSLRCCSYVCFSGTWRCVSGRVVPDTFRVSLVFRV
jgi:hypothetical protein